MPYSGQNTADAQINSHSNCVSYTRLAQDQTSKNSNMNEEQLATDGGDEFVLDLWLLISWLTMSR